MEKLILKTLLYSVAIYCLLFIPFTGNAQVELKAEYFPMAGDTVDLVYNQDFYYRKTIDEEASFMSFNADFRFFDDTSHFKQSFDSINNQPGSFRFKKAEMVLNSSADSVYFYLYRTAKGIFVDGLHSYSKEIGGTIDLEPDQLYVPFSLKEGDTIKNYSRADIDTLYEGNKVKIVRSIHKTFQGVNEFSLFLEEGFFKNALLTKTTTVEYDTIFANIGGLYIPISNSMNKVVQYDVAIPHYPGIIMSFFMDDSATTIQGGNYTKGIYRENSELFVQPVFDTLHCESQEILVAVSVPEREDPRSITLLGMYDLEAKHPAQLGEYRIKNDTIVRVKLDSVPSSNHSLSYYFVAYDENELYKPVESSIFQKSSIVVWPEPEALVQDTFFACRNYFKNIFANGGSEYLWFPSIGLSDSSAKQPTLTLGSDQEYQVIVKNACGADTGETYVKISPFPAYQAPKPQSFCQNDTMFLSIGKRSNVLSYSWQVQGTFFAFDTDTFKIMEQSGTEFLRLRIYGKGCTFSETIPMTVNALPEAQKIAGPDQVTTGSTAYYLSYPDNGYMYDWKVIGGELWSGQGSNTIRVKWLSDSQRELRVIARNDSGCKTDTFGMLIENSVSLAEGEDVFDWKAYPVPTSGVLSLEASFTGKRDLILIDQTGRILRNFELTSVRVLDMSDLPSGTYFIHDATVNKSLRIQKL